MVALLLLAFLASQDLSDFSRDPAGFAAYAERHASRRDWGDLAGRGRLLLIGESHALASGRLDLAASAQALKGAGVTHLALEMLGTELQPSLDAFCAGTATLEDRRRLQAGLASWGWDPRSYWDLLMAARAAGLRVLALNIPDAQRPALRLRPGQTVLDGTQKALQDLIDRRMEERLSEALRDPSARVVALVGAYHARQLRRSSGLEGDSLAVLIPDPALAVLQPVDEAERLLIEAPVEGPTFIPLPYGPTAYDGAVLY